MREFTAAEIDATGVSYILSWSAFGEHDARGFAALGRAFAQEVMPAFAQDALTRQSGPGARPEGPGGSASHVRIVSLCERTDADWCAATRVFPELSPSPATSKLEAKGDWARRTCSRNCLARCFGARLGLSENGRRLLSHVRSRRVHTAHRLDLDTLRSRLHEANERLAQQEQLAAGWREIVESDEASGRDTSAARDLLDTFQMDLEAAMRDKAQAEDALRHRLLDHFKGVRGRLPENDQELYGWLASAEGKAATGFELTPISLWGEHGRA